MSSIPVLYEDDFLLVFDKPPGLVVTSSETQSSPTVQDILENELKIPVDRGGVVHRLDKDTSGLLLIAKTVDSLTNLQQQFKTRVVKKEYTALVHGFIEKKGRIIGAIGRNPGDREKFAVLTEGGKEAETDYDLVKDLELSDQSLAEIFPDYSKIQIRKLYTNGYTRYALVKCLPLTGRTHQIRVHLKCVNHPIVGDSKYGGRKTARLDKRWCPRQFLHASKIRFNHPGDGRVVELTSQLSEDLKTVLKKLENSI